MKKLLLIIMIAVGITASAQTDSTKSCCSKPKSLDLYVSTGLSTATGNNFNQSTYAGVEIGVCRENVMFGFASGRGNLDFTSDMTENYWYEAKVYATKQIGVVKGFVVAGWGQYYKTTHSFIEYGAGISYSIKKVDLCLTVSNWDNIVYVSPGICFNFSLGK